MEGAVPLNPVTDRELVGLIHEGRKMLGDEITMAVDFGYRWHTGIDALYVLERVTDADIFFAEAALQHDDLAGPCKAGGKELDPHRRRGSSGDRFEVREWLTVGKVGVVQPNIGRGGGLTEIRRIADMCELAGAEVVPHGWKTGITSAAGRHFQAACPAAPVFEHVSPLVFDSPLGRELVFAGAGWWSTASVELPTGPGTGRGAERGDWSRAGRPASRSGISRWSLGRG